MSNICQLIERGAVLIARKDAGKNWRYKLNGAPVLVTETDMLAIQRSSKISMQRMAGNAIRYYQQTPAERKQMRERFKQWKKANNGSSNLP